MIPPESETFSSASSHSPALASSAASDASLPGAGVVTFPASSEASATGSGSSAASAASLAALLTPEQLAMKLNVSRRCLGNWARDRIIPMIKIGRICRFDLPQVLAALKNHEQVVAKR
ncbi:MAG: helix-turn-helix domain-containing protein [Prosthecobacter sp.]|uniref:hypothetical protein n=1 Tax=Prosthecobacter sp. TaxID=1965333 RepID=UPI002615A7DE|nr:hypothetical protein [Prosthecobacter sp.]MCF7788566.1 helix-turn-helix domain-containing protein [Prosthecobacter sp.]